MNKLTYRTISTGFIALFLSFLTNASNNINYQSKILLKQINNYNTADKIVESLYDIKSEFVGLSEKEEKEITTSDYLKKSLERSKQLANEIFCLRTIFLKLNLTGITKATARKRINEITDDVIKYRNGIYQKIIIEKINLDSENWCYINKSMDMIKSNTISINEQLRSKTR